jgi:hypothetical protein
VGQFEFPFSTNPSHTTGRGKNAPSQSEVAPLSPNLTYHQTTPPGRLRVLATEKARKDLRPNFAEKLGKRPFGQEKVQAEAVRVAWKRPSLAKLRPKEKQRDPRLGIEYRADFCN